MDKETLIPDMRIYINKVCTDLYKENNFEIEEIKKHITVTQHYNVSFNGYIKFENENELRKNKFFKFMYDKLSDKYKKLMDNYISTFEYRATNGNRGYRGKVKRFDIDVIKNFYGYDTINFDLVKFYQGKEYFKVHRDYKFSELVASEFIENEKVLQLFKAMVYENENVKNISSALIKGAIISNNEEAVKAVFDLLKAAKLSEGLRASIIDFIDYGSIENYKMFLEYIRSENLVRFSSVKLAFSLFTGAYGDGTKDYTTRANYVMDCLLDNKTEEYLKDENPLKVYIGLYALATEDVEKSINYVYENYKEAKSYRRACFITFLGTSTEIVDSKVITHCLKNEEEHKVKALIISNMPKSNKIYFENDEDKREYIIEILDSIKNVKSTEAYILFDDVAKSYFRVDGIYNTVLQYIKEVGTDELYEKAYALFGKYSIYSALLGKYYTEYTYINEIYHNSQRQALIRGLSSSLADTRIACFDILNKLKIEFTEDEYLELAKMLKSKRSDLRNNICGFFKKAEPSIIFKVSKYLLTQKKDELKSGALSILVDNLEKIQDLEEFKGIQEIIKDKEFAHEVLPLKNNLLGLDKGSKDLAEDEEIFEFDVPTLTWDQKLVEKLTKYDFSLMKELMEKWYDIFIAHKDEEIEVYNYDGSKEFKVIGKDVHYVGRFLYGMVHKDGDEEKKSPDLKEYEHYCFYKEFVSELDNISDEDFALLVYVKKLYKYYNDAILIKGNTWRKEHEKRDLDRYNFYIDNNILPNLKDLKSYIQESDKEKKLSTKFTNFSQIMSCLESYASEEKNLIYNEVESYNKVMLNNLAYRADFYKNNFDNLPEYFNDDRNFKVPYLKNDNILDGTIYFDDNYAFDILKNLLSFYDKEYSPVEVHVYFYFLEKGLISREYLVNKLLNPKFINYNGYATAPILSISRVLRYGKVDSYSLDYKYGMPYIDMYREIHNEVVEKMLAVELQRTDSETKYTKILNRMSIYYGAETFAKCLDKMKKIDFVRGYGYGSTLGIKDVFSEILASTMPEEGLTDEKFKKVIKSYKIADKKLLEASLYNPHFTKFGANYLNIKGLEKAMYYFKAHSLDYAGNVLDETKKMINRYSNFELEDFVDGKMDIKWFKEIQEELSEEDFEKVYDASKFIMGTAKRKRGQYFADAIQGKLDIKEVEEKINDKRNQDMLLCFGLIPLGAGKERETETLRRYKRIQEFFKESKQFGAQRRATETRRGNISLSNLATNYGLDVNRFTWIMEAKLIDEVKDVFEPKVIDEIEVYLSLENVRTPEVIVHKNGKKLKSIPAKYKKDEHIKRIAEVKKDIKSQYIRARVTLENSMTNSDVFDLEEIELINTHPIVKEIVKDVLFISDGFIGFLRGNELVNFKDKTHKLTKKSKIRIAHCVDLFDNEWDKWQSYAMEKEIVQPFKQIFRELYTLTEEEKANDGFTNRFAGYQIEGKKALGVLSSRNWLINDYDGFEKVNHAHDLRIDLYCYADWRNANELEDETLEKVTFINNKTNKTMNMQELDKILFSETMRDLDLVVSVAYVGGVDPLLNHTTLEMRKRILEHNLNLFKIKNYEIKEKHIFIDGTLGKYSIHLGSGVVSVEGKGMLPMTPVHDQKRGHIFLPFVDQDPKTAEIITKVLMLAEDNKLKDPTILQYLK